MSDVLKGLTGGWNFLVSWVFPSALAWSVFALFVFPKLQHVPIFKDIGSTSAGNQALVLVGASILTGLLLNGLSTVLFRVIEGYYLRPPIDVWMRRRQQRQQQKLMNKLRRLQDERENWEQRPAEIENSRGETEPKADES